MSHTRSLSALLLVLAALAALPARADAQQRRTVDPGLRDRVDTTFAFDKRGTVSLTAMSGDIVVTGWSRDQIQVHVRSDDNNVRFDASTNRVALELRTSRGGDDAIFEVSVPIGVRVIARTRSGDITIRGTKGEIEAHTQSGDMTFDDVATRLDVNTVSGDMSINTVNGDVSISTVGGDVRARDIRGTVDIKTTSGDIELHGVVSKLVRVGTTSGDVDFDGAIDPAGRYELSSHSGDVGMRIPRDASAQLSVSTWSGEIDSEFPMTIKPGDHGIGAANAKRLTFEIGGGGARITAETFSGDITISATSRSNRN